ncbi:hypothetical protein GJ744_012013 [Endocarpon pusillum]|uniref:Uncharacterized protein n=1 Tax=Endocarpon pusillum TaxID=364733 RepID=A0A8H7AP87_9EURO|nr:hypothetical protein GJ744_012013 [Endocarpon pusillum]
MSRTEGISTTAHEKETGDENRLSKRKSIGYLLHHIVCLAWLGPAIAILYLNFSEYVVGASIGCFSCRLNPFSSATFNEETRLDRRDHNAVGGLQIASKAMEVWFGVIAAGILYDLLVILTKPGRDLPIGILAKYVQFSDILSLAEYPKGTKKHAHRIFLVFVGFMGILVNLMGPSAAVLMIPTLQWRETSFQALGTFDKLASAQPPQDAAVGKDCTTDLLAAGNFSCTASLYEHSLDQLFASVAGSLEQIGQTEVIFNPVISQERQVSFIVNTTNPDVDWIPSRQVAREISDDYLRYSDGVKQGLPGSNYTALANSLSTFLIRRGPTIGLAGGCYRGSLSNVTLGDEKTIRCYGGWDLYAENGTDYVRCIRVGSDTDVDVYFADHVYTPTSPNNPPCFVDGKPQAEPSCDWNEAFLADAPNDRVRNTSTNTILVEYTVPNLSNPNRTVWCDDISYLGFQEYSMDPSPFSNFIHLTQLETTDPRPHSDVLPLVVHTDWFLAGWSVDRGSTVDATRIAAQTIISLVKEALNDSADKLDLTTLNFMDGVAANQALSMINYLINSTNGTASFKSPDNLRKANPILSTGVRVYVRAYGLGSRSSVLSLVVLCIGVLSVLIRVLLALVVVSEREGQHMTPRSVRKLLIAALEHSPVENVRIMEGKARFSIRQRTVSFTHQS